MRLILPVVIVTLGLLEASFASIINHPRMLLLDNKRAGEEDRSIARRRSASTAANTRASARPFFSGKTHRIRTALSLPAISMILDNVQQISKTVIPRVRSSSHVGPATIFLSCLFGYNIISPFTLARAHASTSTTSLHNNPYQRSTSTKMNAYQIIGRSVRFWIQAAPIILHYQFTKTYLATNPNLRKIPTDTSESTRNGNIFNTVMMDDEDENIRSRTRRQQRRDAIYQSLHETHAPRTLSLILQMRGLFVKIGQVLSSRPDFVPSQYIDLLQTLQDDVPPLDEVEIIDIVKDSLWRDHGLELGEVFEGGQLEGVLGTASIGQVHKATLTEDFFHKVMDGDAYRGRRVVAVKVMHLDAEDRFRNDFKILKWLCRLALPGWTPLLLELERQMMTEFDYHNEARNLKTVGENMMDSPYRHKVQVPKPIVKFSSRNVLIMEYLDGIKLEQAVENDLVSALKGDRALAKSLIKAKRTALFEGTLAANADTMTELKQVRSMVSHFPIYSQLSTMLQLAFLQRTQSKTVNLLLDVHGHQILTNGIFNGDPHPGNILMLSNGKLGLIDYGQCKRLEKDQRLALSKVVMELGSPVVNDEAVNSAMYDFGFRFKNDNTDAIRETARLFFDSDGGSRAAGCTNPQEYYQQLQKLNPFVVVPDEAVFVARTSFLFRGMGALLGTNIETSKRWSRIIVL